MSRSRNNCTPYTRLRDELEHRETFHRARLDESLKSIALHIQAAREALLRGEKPDLAQLKIALLNLAEHENGLAIAQDVLRQDIGYGARA